jgi:two-component system, chemotaxis family, CheB/CheR fusion protein
MTRKILSDNLFPVVGVGASAGGLVAFRELLSAIPEHSGMAWVLVQHLDPNHESLLPELLQKATKVPVLEIADDVKVLPDHIYILPSNKMLVANDGVLQLSPRTTPKGALNLPIDLFFTSLAEIHHNHAIGVVLSGTGSDGTVGLKAIRNNGGITVAQDEISATHAGMPNSAVQAGVVDFVLRPADIPQKLAEVVSIIRKNGLDGNQDVPGPEVVPVAVADVFRQILSLLKVRKQTDFTYYKQTTIHRRILRRMAINKNEEPADYLAYLRQNKPEQDALYQDLLIPVTSFFRDAKTFDTLCETVFPGLIANKPPAEPIRVWVAGCSTGEEAYSMAMCLKETLGDRQDRVQIFASDLSEPAIAKARAGVYTKADVADLSPQRLNRFFSKTNGGYQVNKPIRDMCVFAAHNFLKDPPFGKMDLVSCRNVLIYMESYLQKKALTTFHYALNPAGFLLLGKAENIGGVPELFVAAAKHEKLFTRKDAPARFMPIASQRTELNASQNTASHEPEPMRTDFQKTADDIILSKYTPVGVVVNEALDIVHFRGNTGNYLEQVSGKPTHNLLLMAKNGLAFELRNLLHKAKKDKVSVSKENIPIAINGNLHTISIEAMLLPNTIEPHYLVLFHDINLLGNKAAVGAKKAGTRAKKDDKDQRILQLEQELAQAREDMRAISEDQEVINEELQSANEELLSGNEELQSLNEELETSKEELQSTNEELTVVNQEMVGLNEQITTARNYAEAIIANIREPLLVLDSRLRIKTANNAFYNTLRVNAAETEGELIYDLGNRQWNIPALRTLLEHILPQHSVFNDFEITHTFSTIGERTMLLNAREILSKTNAEKLILLSIEDITEVAISRTKIQESHERFQGAIDAVQGILWTNNAAGEMDGEQPGWASLTGQTMAEYQGYGWLVAVHPDDAVQTVTAWSEAVRERRNATFEHRVRRADGTWGQFSVKATPLRNPDGLVREWVGVHTDITAEREADEKIRQNEKLFAETLKTQVAEQTIELANANEALAEKNKTLAVKNRELESFTYVSSHDLQEPLRKIQTLASRILETDQQHLTASSKDSFQRMQKAAERMQRLIQDLLAFSRLNDAERTFKTVDLGLILDEVTGELSETITEKQAVIDADDLGLVRVIVFQFRQLLQNLISNALKFARPGVSSHIVIRGETIKGSKTGHATLLPKTNYFHLSVADNGIGFDPQYSEKIFDVFQRLHGRETYQGTGIGLAIVKKIVENHDGIITATNEPGNGARFDVYIPAK